MGSFRSTYDLLADYLFVDRSRRIEVVLLDIIIVVTWSRVRSGSLFLP